MSLKASVLLNPAHFAATALLTLGVMGAAQAQAEPDNKWHGGVAIGGAAASGNTSSQALSATADAARANKIDKISLYALTNYGRNTVAGVRTTTADQVRVGGRYDYNLTDTVFVFGGSEVETNKAAGLKSRYGVNAGAGYKVIRSATTAFDVFAGVGFSGVKFNDDSKADGAELLLGEESAHKLSETTSFKQRFIFRPGQNDLGNLATFDAGLATAISGGWTLNTGLAMRYASKVAVGLKSTDTLLTVGFGYKY
jgi:putative salt-induced outer membrane protein